MTKSRKIVEEALNIVLNEKERKRLLAHYFLWQTIGKQNFRNITVISILGLIGGFFSKWIALIALGIIFYTNYDTYERKKKDDKNYPEHEELMKNLGEDFQ